ncbi:MAG: RdgB/HAM1 family non-canonical purine NTP pyrophosphatase [Coriobacteriaceae bacterium]|jgi:XTP/dITP diphosphohydrolase|nr:RdgB/HAM1 family non-canonical purine NTP pyrophosphatase [Coriobacteriaceae bacterium]
MADVKTVILATNNAHKVSEISNALDFPGWEFKTLREMGIESDPDEDADTFLGNARIKALAAHRASGGLAALADDSGLVVDALDGAPGVYSSRFAGEDATDEDNNNKLLADLEGVPDEERTARFVCTLYFIDEDEREVVAQGKVEGRIGHEPQGEGGFGYDPLFWPDVFDGECTLAEVPQERKNEVSHRGNALRTMRFKIEVAEARKEGGLHQR